jgi:phage-related protein
MAFSVVGSDALSPVLDHAGDSALVMAGRIELAATEADLSMAGLTRDLEHRVRDAAGQVIPESEALGRAIGSRISESMDETLSSLHPAIEVDADSRPADAEVAALFRRLESLRDVQIGVDIPVDEAIVEVDSIHRALEELSTDHADPDVRVSADAALFSLDLLRDEVDRLDADRATIDVDIDAARALAEAEAVRAAVHRIGDDDGPDRARGRFGALGSMVGRVGGAVVGMATTGGASLLRLGASAGAILPLIAGVVTTLVNVAPAGAIAATGIIGVVGASITLKLAMSGVGDAVKAALDPHAKAADLKKALDGLSPPARAFVLVLHQMSPALHRLQQDVQATVFYGLAGQVKTLGSTLLPQLRDRLTDTGSVFNLMASQALDTATKLGKSGVLDRALSSANNSLYDLAGVPSLVIQALGQLGAAAGPTLNRLTSGVSGAVDTLSARLTTAFQSGGMTKAIDTAVGLIKEIGTVLGNVGSVIGSVMSAAQASGGGWLAVLGDISGAMAAAFASPDVQSALGSLFSTMALLGKTVAPLVAMALSEIAPVLVELGPPAQLLISTLGDALRPVIKALGPVLVSAAQAVGALVTAAAPLLPVIGDLIASVLPILNPALSALSSIFLELQGPVQQIATALGTALQPVVGGLSTVLDDLVQQGLTAFMGVLSQLLPLVPTVTPVLLQLGQSVGQILVAAAPLVPQVLMLSTIFLTKLLPAILPLIPPAADLATVLLILATDVIVKIVIPALQRLQDWAGALMRKLQPAIDAVGAVSRGIAAAFDWVKERVVGKTLPEIVGGVLGWFGGLPGKTGAALEPLAGRVGAKVSAAGRSMIGAVRDGVTGAVSWVNSLPGRARDALGDLSGVLIHAGKSLIGGFITGILSKVSDAGHAASSVLGKVKGFFPNSPAKEGPFSGAGWTLYSGQAVMDDWIGGMTSRTADVVSAVGGVTGAAAAAMQAGAPAPGAGGLGAAAGVARGQTVTIPITVNGALDPVAVARQIQQILLNLKRLTGVDIDLGTAGGVAL